MKNTTTPSPILPTSVPGDSDIIQEVAQKEGFRVEDFSSLPGGSINRVYLLKTSEGPRVIKINDPHKFPGMFAAEKEGLQELRKAKAIDGPEVLGVGENKEAAWLLLEYKEQVPQKSNFWNSFAEGLSALHRNSAESFGFHSDNYIGSLPQYNNHETSAVDFYINQRLEPQFRMAAEKGFSFDKLNVFYKNISEEIPAEPPSLLHGDLWSGNYIINEHGLPCLIDPAVCYGPREMDLGMMKLFGGFSETVFSEYKKHFPLTTGFEQRVPIWQLYYLLVHLNIFGKSYLASVKNILSRFS